MGLQMEYSIFWILPTACCYQQQRSQQRQCPCCTINTTKRGYVGMMRTMMPLVKTSSRHCRIEIPGHFRRIKTPICVSSRHRWTDRKHVLSYSYDQNLIVGFIPCAVYKGSVCNWYYRFSKDLSFYGHWDGRILVRYLVTPHHPFKLLA